MTNHSVFGVNQADWGMWASAFALVESDHHAGTAGWTDSTFYLGVDVYLASVPAPEDVVASVALMRGLRSLDFGAAAAAADRLGATTDRPHLMPPATVLDAVMAAYIGAGRLDDARAAYRILAPRVPEPYGVRSLMLAALVGAPPPGS